MCMQTLPDFTDHFEFNTIKTAVTPSVQENERTSAIGKFKMQSPATKNK